MDLQRSEIRFSALVEQPNGDDRATVVGQVGHFAVQVIYDPMHPEAATLDVHLDLTSLTTGRAAFDQQMKGIGWFETNAFPKGHYRARGFLCRDNGSTGLSCLMSGDLTLHGTTVPIQLFAVLRQEPDGWTRVTGSASVPRLDFGLGTRVAPDMVSKSVTVAVTLFARPAAESKL